MLTTHIKAKKKIFLFFSKFCRFLFGFSYANFYLVSCKILKVVKIEFDTSYLSWGSSPKLTLGSLLLVGVEPSPTVVGPPLLLGRRSKLWILSPVCRCQFWVDSMCWPSDSSMLVVRTFTLPICRVRVANLCTKLNVWRRSGVHWN